MTSSMTMADLAKKQTAKIEAQRTKNRQRVERDMPEFAKLFDQLTALGMSPLMKVLKFNTEE